MDDAAIVLRALASCALIIATLAGIAWATRSARGTILRPFAGGLGWAWPAAAAAPPRRLAIVDRVALGPGSGIALVRCDGRALVLGLCSSGISLLATLDDPEAARSGITSGSS